MKIWHYLPDSGKCLSFVRLVESEDGPMAAANAVCTALWPVVQPLEVAFSIAGRPHDSPFIDYKIPVPVSGWRLREVYIPAHVAIAAWVKDFKPNEPGKEEIPELTPQALADWLARAHAQQLPEGYVPALDRLHMYFTRARLLEHQEPSAELALGPETSAIPVEKHEDGLWVSGSIVEERINPPIEITLLGGDEQLELNISVYWSPWIEAGSAEAELLRACLHEIENQGWH